MMEINVRKVSQQSQEAVFSVDNVKFETGLLSHDEAVDLAGCLLDAASQLLGGVDRSGESDVVNFVIEKL